VDVTSEKEGVDNSLDAIRRAISLADALSVPNVLLSIPLGNRLGREYVVAFVGETLPPPSTRT
jgi:hypothetical protein